MFSWVAGAFVGKAKIFISLAVAAVVIGGSGFAGYQIFLYGKLQCRAEIQEIIENERRASAKKVEELESRLQRERSMAGLRIREIYRDNGPCLDSAIPDSVFQALRDSAD